MGLKASRLSKLVNGAVRGPSLMAPKGYFPICVGLNNDTKRFIVHRRALDDVDFLELLHKSAEEYGFCNQGVLRIPYELRDFEAWMINRSAKRKVIHVK